MTDGVVITSVDLLDTIKECNDVSIPITYTDAGAIEHLDWYIDGNLPKGLEFLWDNNNPRIVGKVKMFIDQDDIPRLDFYPNEDLKADGSNRMNNGDFKYNEFLFNFTIKHNYKSIDPNTLLPVDGIATANASIVLTHMDNKQNTMFMRKYLENDTVEEISELILSNGFLESVIRIKEREIPYDGRVYRKSDLDDLLRDHPGPFSICEGS